jgi:hypothetical protein
MDLKELDPALASSLRGGSGATHRNRALRDRIPSSAIPEVSVNIQQPVDTAQERTVELAPVPQVAPVDEDADVNYGDYWDATQAGMADLAGAVGGILQMAGLQDLGTSVVDYWNRAAENQVGQMSAEGQKQMNRSFLGEDGILSNPTASNTGDSLMLKIIRSAPNLLVGFIPGGLAARAGLGVKGMMAAGAVGEGTVGAGFSAAEISKTLDSWTDEQLQEKFASEWGSALDQNGGDVLKAREMLKETAVQQGGLIAGALSAASGAAGGAILGRIVGNIPVSPSVQAAIKAIDPGRATTRTGVAARALMPGALQEGTQEMGEQVGTNYGTRAPLSENLGESFAAGALTGEAYNVFRADIGSE